MDNNKTKMSEISVGHIDTAWQAMAVEIETTLAFGPYYYVECYNVNQTGDLNFGTGCVTL